MAYSSQKSPGKATTSRSLVHLSELTVSAQPSDSCRRHRSVSESASCSSEQRLGIFPHKLSNTTFTSSHTSSSKSGFIWFPSPPEQPKRREVESDNPLASDLNPDNESNVDLSHFSNKFDQQDDELLLECSERAWQTIGSVDGHTQPKTSVDDMLSVERELQSGIAFTSDLAQSNLPGIDENILFEVQIPTSIVTDSNGIQQDRWFSKPLESESNFEETVEQVVSDLIDRLGEYKVNQTAEQQPIKVNCMLSDSTDTLAPDSPNVVCVNDHVATRAIDDVSVGLPTCLDAVSASTCNDAAICYSGTGRKTRETTDIVDYGIFERDVELGGTNSFEDFSFENFSKPGDRRSSRCEEVQSPEGAAFPPDVLAALGNDEDAMLQAAIQWEGALPPGFSRSEDSNQSMCRICHAGDSRESLLSPCRCDGSVKWTHQSCLIKWLAESGIWNCELCGYRYKIRRVGSRNCFRWKPITLDITDRLHLILFASVSTFLLVTFVFVAWISLSQNDTAIKERNMGQSKVILPVYSCIQAVALCIVCFEIKYTIQKLYRRWRATNLGIIVLNRKNEDKQSDGSTIPVTLGDSSRQQQQQQPQQQQPQEQGSGGTLDDMGVNSQ